MLNHPILIVDDEPTNLAILSMVLEADYSLVFARTGLEALAAVEKHQPCLILLDIQMPDMDGYAVCEQLKANPITEMIPVIFVTSLSEMGNEKAGFAAGCVDYLSKPIVPEIVLARVRTHLSLVRATQLEKSQRDAIFMLGAAGHYNDNNTGVHIWRMAAYSKVLARALGWSIPEAELLELAAPMHDTGKIGIPDAVLKKQGGLDAEEWLIMKRHCQIGYDILSKSDAPIFMLAAEIALCHHERWDGSGYPQGLVGTAIPEVVRIVTLADVFDALTMWRPYKEPWPLDKVVAFITEGAGQHFDPDMVKVFLGVQDQLMDIKEQFSHKV
ncbi:MAG: response regulator [Methylococcales bacterium]|nr:response regulator [Methylococcales bacterium]